MLAAVTLSACASDDFWTELDRGLAAAGDAGLGEQHVDIGQGNYNGTPRRSQARSNQPPSWAKGVLTNTYGRVWVCLLYTSDAADE